MLACRESRRVSREAAARILALKDRDYAEYLRLARNTKDKRLRTLLDKTDAIISDLGIKVAGFALGAAVTPSRRVHGRCSVFPGPCPATATDCLSHKNIREGPRNGMCARTERPLHLKHMMHGAGARPAGGGDPGGHERRHVAGWR